ncbi:hypothetical protein BACCOP_02775 [Phocaeicola coprocola DSM 17136]|uniref:Uncharacterized protein n=1 Tax=Phocaeicola coprocola DSM 17136 TaxID=470145 RepID=B3JLI0_9BACT|nr:hypothetical protein BACCOP_02775 [Phocaeicola coprocola DSM 17136]
MAKIGTVRMSIFNKGIHVCWIIDGYEQKSVKFISIHNSHI